jgi:ABC-type amino acid transport substrate-binding protein
MVILRLLVYIFFLLEATVLSGQNNNLNISYSIRPPFVMKDSAGVKGLEIDIINEYALWLKSVKKIDFSINYNQSSDINALINELKQSNKNTIGIGGFSSGFEKTPELDYTTPHLKNLSFCITNGNAPDIKSKNQTDIYRVLANMTALTISNSNLFNCTNDIKKQYIKELQINYTNTQAEILNAIAKNILIFGYVDAIEFWFFLKTNPNKFLKVQKPLEQSKENYSFLIGKNSEHKLLFNEFFTSFKTGPKYRIILEKYLGGFMSQNMAIK